MAAPIDAGDTESIGQAVEAQGPRQRNDMAAIDQAAAKPSALLGKLVEMHPRGILEQAGGELVFGLLHRHAVEMVDLFTDRIVVKTHRRTGLGKIPFC